MVGVVGIEPTLLSRWFMRPVPTHSALRPHHVFEYITEKFLCQGIFIYAQIYSVHFILVAQFAR